MDLLNDIEQNLAETVYVSVPGPIEPRGGPVRFRDHVDLFETKAGDEPIWRDEAGWPVAAIGQRHPGHRRRPRGGSAAVGGQVGRGSDLWQFQGSLPLPGGSVAGGDRDGRDRDRHPGQVWRWPGNTGGTALIRQIQDDMPNRISPASWVADRSSPPGQWRPAFVQISGQPPRSCVATSGQASFLPLAEILVP